MWIIFCLEAVQPSPQSYCSRLLLQLSFIQVPTRRAAKGITPTPRHVGLTLTLKRACKYGTFELR